MQRGVLIPFRMLLTRELACQFNVYFEFSYRLSYSQRQSGVWHIHGQEVNISCTDGVLPRHQFLHLVSIESRDETPWRFQDVSFWSNDFYELEWNCWILKMSTVDGRNPANQLSLVVYPIIYMVFIHSRRLFGISEPSTVGPFFGGVPFGGYQPRCFNVNSLGHEFLC